MNLHKSIFAPKRTITMFVVMMLFVSLVPAGAYATEGTDIPAGTQINGNTVTSGFSYTDGDGTVHSFYTTENGFGWSKDYSNTKPSQGSGSGSGGGTWDADYYSSDSGNSYKNITKKIIEMCKNYSRAGSELKTQILYMSGIYSMATQRFVSDLGLADALLISLLNHEDINSGLLKSDYTSGDLNRIIAGRINDNASGYADVDSIANSTGLSAKEVSEILTKIAEGRITKESIEKGKNISQHTNRGPAQRAEALKQEKVYSYLLNEVQRMTTDEQALSILYDDLGEGYVKNMMSGQSLDRYRVMLYKEHLAKVLDEEKEENIIESVTGAETYKVSGKVRSAISNIYKHEIDHEKSELSEELQQFLDEHLKNGVLSEKEAREYLILSDEFEAGQDGLGEAAKQLANGVKHLQGLKKALDASGKVFDTLGKVKKVDEFIEYWAKDYSQQELMLAELVDSLAASGADAEMLVAAKELKAEYDSKLTGTFNKVYGELVDKGIGTVKSAFPPLKIVETCISLSAMLVDADDKVDALETALAMQGICDEAIKSYENAVLNICNGDESQEAVLRVSNSYALAKQSLTNYYEAMIILSDSEAEKEIFATELKNIEKMVFGAASTSPFRGGGGGGGGR